MKIIKQVRAPVRIDFAGGTTDISPFKDKYGGWVLNAAIDKYIYGKLIATNKKVGLEYHGDIPTSSGLGTSGVMNLVWLALISKTKNKKELAEGVYKLEQAMGLVGGKQDQYAGALGGINFLEFKGEKVKATRLNLNRRLVRKLENSLVLVYTGKPHFSGDSNRLAIENLKKGKNTDHFLRLKEIAKEMKNCLLKGKLDRFAELMNEETKQRDDLHRVTVPLAMEKTIKKAMKGGAVAAKVCGSGSGGSILFFGDKKKLGKRFKGKIINFRFDWKGLQIN